jgi:hypothetical protein
VNILPDRPIWVATINRGVWYKEGHMKITFDDIAKHAEEREQPFKESLSEFFYNYTFPGAYPVYYLTPEGDALCAECAKTELLDRCDDLDFYLDVDVYYEGPSIYCEECNKIIESAYGDPMGE